MPLLELDLNENPHSEKLFALAHELFLLYQDIEYICMQIIEINTDL